LLKPFKAFSFVNIFGLIRKQHCIRIKGDADRVMIWLKALGRIVYQCRSTIMGINRDLSIIRMTG